jgi:uncharacterized membrane protein YfcA
LTGWWPLWLVLAGVAAGLLASIGGLASLVSYPALLLAGLPPTAANVTNTVALVATTAGAAAGSRPELAGQGRYVRRLCVLSVAGGVAGAVLLLTTPAGVFELVVPGLIAGASIVLLLSPWIRRRAARNGAVADDQAVSATTQVGVVLVSVYSGYFGAAAGVIMLAILTAVSAQPLARINAAKNMICGAANAVAAVIFAVIGPVHWLAALALATGSLAGGWIGPSVVRRLPAGPLRVAIGIAGLGLAAKLALDLR